MAVRMCLDYRRSHDRTAHDTVPYDNDIAPAAALIADPTRAAILRALVPDRPLAAGELARLAASAPPPRASTWPSSWTAA